MASFNTSQGVDLLKSKRFSDFNICCEGYSFAVHKNIIYQKSDFFAACIDGSFQEAKDSTLTIREADAIAVASLVLFIYTGKYEMATTAEVWAALEPRASAAVKSTL